jgi:FkbM family methyltransferase
MRIKRRPVAFVLASSGHGSLILNRNDYRMLTDTQGYGVGFQVLNTSYYDPEEVDVTLTLLVLRKKIVGSGVIAVDCGANIGVHTIEWAKAMHGWGEVIALEAQERIYYALAGNIALNNCFNAKAIHAAVGTQCGMMHIPVPDYCVPSSFGSLELIERNNNEFIGQTIRYSADTMRPTTLLSIDSLALDRLDFMKVDVEGMELEVLSGAAETIEHHHPMLLVESIKVDRRELFAMLRGANYCTFQVGMNVLSIHESDPCFQHIHAKEISE